MPINPVTGVMVNPGDVVVAPALNGDPKAVLSISGSFSNVTVAVDAIPLGQPGQWGQVSEVSTTTGQLITQLGPVTTGPAGGSFTLLLDAGAYLSLRLRLVSTGGGNVVGTIATITYPASGTGPVIQAISGTVTIGGVSVPLLNWVYGPANQPIGATGEINDGVFVQDRQMRAWMERTEDWMKKIYFLLLYQASGGLGTGETPVEFMSAYDNDMDPMDQDSLDRYAIMGDR